jgi:aryl-alcohol dehydrogenase-like predicted oxidoreductase
MKMTRLGDTGLLVSRLCLGAMTFGKNQWGIGGLTEREAAPLVDQAIDGGINFFDTADVYARGESEEILGKILSGRRSRYIVATKVRARMSDDPNDVGLSRHHILDSVDRSLARLRTDYIDLYQVHSWDPLTRPAETLRALDDLVRWGKVRYIGCSNFAAWQLAESLAVSDRDGLARYETLQAYYSLAGRDLEHELAPLCEYRKMGILTWSPLAGGYLSGKYRKGAEGRRTTSMISNFPPVDPVQGEKVLDACEAVAGERGVPIASVALAWQLSRPFVTSVILGAKSGSQLAENLTSAEIDLSAGEIARLDDASAAPLPYPQWMLAFTTQERKA